jgi:4-hydroxy-4-methyl-2-oxoglutarate aldolase
VWSADVSLRGAGKHSAGEDNVPVVCGGVQINPGDIVVADDDGVAVIPGVTRAPFSPAPATVS